MRILSIESSCDETSAAILEKNNDTITVLSHITATSLDIHATTGGIIPENAARMQVQYIMPVITKALCESIDSSQKTKDTSWDIAHKVLEQDIDAIAVTYGPGLIGSLLVGVETAKTLSYVFKKPLVPVNHLLAHIYANFITDSTASNFTRRSLGEGGPFIGLIISGGHTDLLLFRSHADYTWLGGTRDDAAGEAFDKTGRLLSLPYPAGPEIERRAGLVKNPTIKFKSPLMHEDNFDFSFSGLKTEVMRYVQTEKLKTEKLLTENRELETDNWINEVCYATQKAILDVVVKKTLKAAEQYNCGAILIGGGVSANQTFRDQITSEISNLQSEIKIYFPEKEYSTDNGAMIGAYALMNYNPVDWQKVTANPELYFA